MRWIVRRLPELSAKAWIGIAIAAAFVVSEVTGAKGDLRIDEQARACQTLSARRGRDGATAGHGR